MQQLLLATAALSVGTAVNLANPEASQSALVQFPVADLRNEYYLVCNDKPGLDATSLSSIKIVTLGTFQGT